MGIEFIILFSMFIVYVIVTETRIWFKEKNWDLERKSLIKSLLEEADIRKTRELQEKELKLFHDSETKNNMYNPKSDLKEKIIYSDDELEEETVFDKVNKDIDNYQRKQKENR